MHIRPRCREWLPLATQQLRLRNLVRIHGLNIECVDRNSLIYYTLHKTAHEIEFYKSEPLPARQQQQKWAEISSTELLKSNLNCICVKVWEQWTATADDLCLESSEKTKHHLTNEKEHLLDGDNLDEQESALSKMLTNSYPNSAPRPPDKLLFVWGVYFSGLTLINQSIESKFQSNSLIFQINGDFFAKPESFPLHSLMAQLSYKYERFAAYLPHPEETPVPDEFLINSPKVSRSSSPVAIADFDPQQERYIELKCNRIEVRRSYDLEKLLKIQKLQRLCLQNSKDALEITTEIKQQCARCITGEQLKRKKRTNSTTSAALHQHHSMGRALSLLLSEQQELDPQVLLHTQKLQKEIESFQCKRQLLQTEYDTYSMRISQLRQSLAAVKESRQKLQESLNQRQQQLQQDKQLLEERNNFMLTESERKHVVVQNVERRMSSLCMELSEIYPISTNYKGFFTVCSIPFPKMDAYLNDFAQDPDMTPMALSASLGYVAHLVQMISVIINRPLRNPIHHEGSRTRIEDVVKDIPYASREFPLYSRSTIPSKPVKYAIQLLNQNIAQLCYDITGERVYLRATIENIMHIFSKLQEIERSLSREIQTNISADRINLLTLLSSTTLQENADGLSKSHSSVELNNEVPVPKFSPHVSLPSSIPMPIADRGSVQQRISRSVGSYSDCEDDFKDITDHCYSNSDSNITTNQSFAN